MFDEFQQKAQGVLERFKDELKKVRTGRAQPSMVDSVVVEVASYGGARMKINELASLNTPDPSSLVIQPFDPSVTQDIERAITAANLGFSPAVDQHVIRISVPPLTAERREQMKDIVDKNRHEFEIALQAVRRAIREKIEAQTGISEDDIARDLQRLEKEVATTMTSLHTLAEEKKKELGEL